MVLKRAVGAITSAGVLAALLVGVGATPGSATEYLPSDPNPDLNAQCGLNFGLVLDSSGSIGETGIQNLKDASTSFVESLADTGSTVSVTSFSTKSPGSGGTNLEPTALSTSNLPTIKDSYKDLVSTGFTNWEDGLEKSQDNFDFPGAPDLIVFITDGNPNTTNSSGGGGAGTVTATNAAITIANEMKNDGVHMFGIAVGDGVNLTPIQKVTSDVELLADGSNFSAAGYTETESYATLAKTLKTIAVELCAPSLTINKVVTSSDNPEPVPADGWKFDTTITIRKGGGAWVEPGVDPIAADTPSTKSQTTSQGGAANFQWEPAGNFDTDPVIVREVQQPGYEIQPNLVCVAKNLVEGKEREFTATLDNGQWSLGKIEPKEIVSCTATNESRDTAQLKLVKEVQGKANPNSWTLTATGPQGAPKVENLGGSGDFTKVWWGVEYTLGESGPGGYSPSDWVCLPAGEEPLPAAVDSKLNDGDKITLKRGQKVTCTIVNTRDLGSLTITKEFNAQASGYTGTFDINYTCVDGADPVKNGTVSLGAGQSQTISGLPTGTVCTVVEPALPPNPTGWTFNQPTYIPASGQATVTTKDQAVSVTVVNSVSQVSPVVVKKVCPIKVTLVKPKPKKVGNRVLIKKIKTKKSSCKIVKPVVLCRPLKSSAAGEKAFCDTKVTKKGKIRVKTRGYDKVKVTVIVRSKPKKGYRDEYKPNTWRKSWILR
jgi:hypothetical protein